VKRLITNLAHALLGEYAIYHIYCASGTSGGLSSDPGEFSYGPLDRAQVEASGSSLLRDQIGFLGVGAHAYGCWHEGELVALCVYWFGDRYRTRNFWPLEEGEAKLVQIVVAPQARGKGVASRLIARSRDDMLGRGFRRTYARIWHSNVPSLRAFERAGWGRIATVVEVNPLRLSRPWRISASSRGRTPLHGVLN
jgi:RimJ/RimL family protein N-acetyltransferase